MKPFSTGHGSLPRLFSQLAESAAASGVKLRLTGAGFGFGGTFTATGFDADEAGEVVVAAGLLVAPGAVVAPGFTLMPPAPRAS